MFSHRYLSERYHIYLNGSKFPLVSWNLLIIMGNFNNAAVWIVSVRPPISNFPTPIQRFEYRFKCANYNWYDNYTNIFSFLCFLARSKYLSFFSFSLILNQWSTGMYCLIHVILHQNCTIWTGLFVFQKWPISCINVIIQQRSWLRL